MSISPPSHTTRSSPASSSSTRFTLPQSSGQRSPKRPRSSYIYSVPSPLPVTHREPLSCSTGNRPRSKVAAGGSRRDEPKYLGIMERNVFTSPIKKPTEHWRGKEGIGSDDDGDDLGLRSRREMSVPLLSESLSTFSLSHRISPVTMTSRSTKTHHSTPPSFESAHSSLSFTPRRSQASAISPRQYDPSSSPLAKAYVYPATAPLPPTATFLGSPFESRPEEDRSAYERITPSRQYSRVTLTERLDHGYFQPYEHEYLHRPFSSLGEGKAAMDNVGESGSIHAPGRKSWSSTDELTSGTSSASLYSLDRTSLDLDQHHPGHLPILGDNDSSGQAFLAESLDNATPVRRLFPAPAGTDTKSAKDDSKISLNAPSSATRIETPRHLTKAVTRHPSSTTLNQSSAPNTQSPGYKDADRSPLARLTRLLSVQRTRTKTRSVSPRPLFDLDNADDMTDTEDNCPPTGTSQTMVDSSPCVKKTLPIGLGIEGTTLPKYWGTVKPSLSTKTRRNRAVSTSSTTSSSSDPHQSPSRPFSSRIARISASPTKVTDGEAFSPARSAVKLPSTVGLGRPIRPPFFRRGITEPGKTAFLSPASIRTPGGTIFSEIRPSPAAFASAGLVKKRPSFTTSALPKFGASEPFNLHKKALEVDNARKPQPIITSPNSPIAADRTSRLPSLRSVSNTTTSSVGSNATGTSGSRSGGGGLRRKKSTMFGVTNVTDAVHGSPATPTKYSVDTTVEGFDLTTPSPRETATSRYPFTRGDYTSPSHASDAHGTPSSNPAQSSPALTRLHELRQNRPLVRLSNPMLDKTFKEHAVTGHTAPSAVGAASVLLGRDLVVVRSIGKGEFSQVWEVKDKEGKVWAVKAGKPYTGSKNRFRQMEEISILRQLSLDPHPHIIDFKDSWEHAGRLHMRTELFQHGDLSFFLDRLADHAGLGEARVWKTLVELSSGLSHIHANNFLHLDIKPSNILITAQGQLKMADFGMSSVTADDGYMASLSPALPQHGPDGAFIWDTSSGIGMIKSPVLDREVEGDREYLSPEGLADGPLGREADVYSLGILLLEAALNVVLPPNGECWVKLRSDDFSDLGEHYNPRGETPSSTTSKKDESEADQLPTISVHLLDTIKGMMRSDRGKRLTLDDVGSLGPVIRAREAMEVGRAGAALKEEEAWFLREILEEGK